MARKLSYDDIAKKKRGTHEKQLSLHDANEMHTMVRATTTTTNNNNSN
jgi:hypothetical protein